MATEKRTGLRTGEFGRSRKDDEDLLRQAYPSFHRLVAARAVLSPLCRRSEVIFPPCLDTVRAVRALWQHRVTTLRAAGWSPVEHVRHAAYAKNCPPHAFAFDDSGRIPCNRYRACPFCAALQAEILYENVHRALQRMTNPPCLFVCVLKTRFESLTPLYGVKRIDEWIARCQQYFIPPSSEPTGMVVRITMEPKKSYPNGWHIGARFAALLAYPHGARIPPIIATYGNRVKPGGLSLAYAVAHVARYPKGLLFGDATLAAKVLQRNSQVQLSTTRGVFRSARAARTIGQIRHQRLAPSTRRPLAFQRRAEAEHVRAHLPPSLIDHEREAVRLFLTGLGRAPGPTRFVEVKSLPVTMRWLGVKRMTSLDLMKHTGRMFRDDLRRHKRLGLFSLVFLWAEKRYYVLSKLTDHLFNDALQEPGYYSGWVYHGQKYLIEPLAQLALRLREAS